MRFSNKAIIFESASIFVATLAASTTGHIEEMEKSFQCDNRFVEPNEFSIELYEAKLLLFSGRMHPVDARKVKVLVDDQEDRRTILYDDQRPTSYYFYKLDSTATTEYNGQDILNVHLALVLDDIGRLSAMAIRKISRQRGRESLDRNWALPSFSLCSINF
ncbi:BgTH12-05188 [Blumeria graminis f. sp. triticale]|uniref:BgtAcSP-30782 n=3 Tax=Blumeria graminis TaxID=34373 RepID=A0A9X9MHB7_BLUGR|nr:hypothetical protein BGT96224_AcSP30782 [Blumeria graminis f. sp. tritici 96224]CAD6502597.1 BgTH12-05188 [Blumeria graminis f. sp. triticale]VDB88014.1 BgtAcSP-30782 [Blumeria graminis f. sp. tritici]